MTMAADIDGAVPRGRGLRSVWAGPLARAGSLALGLVLSGLASLALGLGSPAAWAHGHEHDEAAVRRLLHDTFDTPQARLVVEPVVVVGRHAIAGWMQGARGGRALLAREAEGRWAVVLCSGDALLDANFLREAGLGRAQAEQAALALRQAEQRLTPAQRAQLASFEGLVRMDAQGRHPPAAAGHAGHAGHAPAHGAPASHRSEPAASAAAPGAHHGRH